LDTRPLAVDFGACRIGSDTSATDVDLTGLTRYVAELPSLRIAIIVGHALDAFLCLWVADRSGFSAFPTSIFRAYTDIVFAGTSGAPAVGAIQALHASGASRAIGLFSSTDFRTTSSLTTGTVTTV
jgi:hypothetical protein